MYQKIPAFLTYITNIVMHFLYLGALTSHQQSGAFGNYSNDNDIAFDDSSGLISTILIRVRVM